MAAPLVARRNFMNVVLLLVCTVTEMYIGVQERDKVGGLARLVELSTCATVEVHPVERRGVR